MRNEKGATTVEATITLMPFFIFVFGIVQVCVMAYAAFTTQYVASRVLRDSAVTATPVVGQTKYQGISNLIQGQLTKYIVPTTSLNISMCDGIVPNCTDQVNGYSGRYVTLQVSFSSPLFLYSLPITVRSIVRNENY